MTESREFEAGTVRKVDVTVTYLEMTEAPKRAARPVPVNVGKIALVRAERPTLSFYRYLHRAVGESWLWYERLTLSDTDLKTIIHDPDVEIFVLYVDGVPAGFAELDRRRAPVVNLAYFGFVPEFIGRSLGSYLLDWAIRRGWDGKTGRMTVNTCSLDHPAALALYQKLGFVPVQRLSTIIDHPADIGIY